MDRRTRMLLDQIEIQQVLARYARGVDRIDGDLIRSVYWEEAIDDHGTYYGKGHDYADNLVERLPRLYSATSHILGQTYFVTMTEHRALTETYFIARHAACDESVDGFTCAGRYLDVLEKRDETWKILRRNLAYDLSVPTSSRNSFMAGQVVGARFPDDISYTLFAT